jgi:hypothetical protein
MGIEVTTGAGNQSKLVEIQDHLESIRAETEAMKPMPSDAMTYSELKMQLMINYIANLSYYLSLKHEGVPVADHPVFKHLAYLRTFMERLAPLDASLKYQIDKLLLENTEEGEQDEDGHVQPSVSGPNIAAFIPSMSSAVKGITVDQVKKTAMDIPLDALNGRLEIDPALIAAQIQKVHHKASTKKRKVKTYVEQDSENDERIDDDYFSDQEVVQKKSMAKKPAGKKMGKKTTKQDDQDDEEIDSDFEL